MALVEVKPIEKDKWHGKKGKEAFSRPITLEALISLSTTQFATGLTAEDRERLEKLTGYNLSPDYMEGTSHPFWNSTAAQIKLEHKTNVFNTSRPLDEIKIKVLKAHDLVANSMKEYKEGKFPLAKFVIFDEAEEVEIKASKLSLKNKVIIEISELSLERKAEIVQILLGISVRNQSMNFVDLKLEDAIEEFGPQRVLTIIQRDKARTSLHSLVLEAIYKNVLRKEGTSVYYMDDQIGFDIENAIDYLADKKNQALKAQIIEKIN